MAPLKGVFVSSAGTSRVASSPSASLRDSFHSLIQARDSVRANHIPSINERNDGPVNLNVENSNRDGDKSKKNLGVPQPITTPIEPTPIEPTLVTTTEPLPTTTTTSDGSVSSAESNPGQPSPNPPVPASSIIPVQPPTGQGPVDTPKQALGTNGNSQSILATPSPFVPGFVPEPSGLPSKSAGDKVADQTISTAGIATVTTIPLVATSTAVFTSNGQTLTSLSTFTTNQAVSTVITLPAASSAPETLSSASRPHARMVIGVTIAAALFFLIGVFVFFILFFRRRNQASFIFVDPPVQKDPEVPSGSDSVSSMTQSAGSLHSNASRRKPVPQLGTAQPLPSPRPRLPQTPLPGPEVDLGEPHPKNPFNDQNPFDDPVKQPARSRLSTMSVIPLGEPVAHRSMVTYAV